MDLETARLGPRVVYGRQPRGSNPRADGVCTMAEEKKEPNEPQALREVLEGLSVRSQQAKADDDTADKKHAFWDTQPVPALSDELAVVPPEEHGPIDPPDLAAVKKEPYTLPPSFVWADVNLDDDAEANELYSLLHENYVEDGDQMFRFDYSIAFLRWALQPPGFRREWHVGVRVALAPHRVALVQVAHADPVGAAAAVRLEPVEPQRVHVVLPLLDARVLRCDKSE